MDNLDKEPEIGKGDQSQKPGSGAYGSASFGDQPVSDNEIRLTPEQLKENPIKTSAPKKTNYLFIVIAFIVLFIFIFVMAEALQDVHNSSVKSSNEQAKKSSQSDKALNNSNNLLNPTGSDGTNGSTSNNGDLKYCSNAITATLAC